MSALCRRWESRALVLRSCAIRAGVLLPALASSLSAQTPGFDCHRASESGRQGQATIRGRVTNTDGLPLPYAIVRVPGSGSMVRAPADGAFTIADAGAGTYTIEARAIGYGPHRVPVVLRASEPATIALKLAVANVQLDTVRVVAGRQIPFLVQGIERRWRTGLGRILDGNTVRERSSLFMTDALRGLPDVSVRQLGGW